MCGRGVRHIDMRNGRMSRRGRNNGSIGNHRRSVEYLLWFIHKGTGIDVFCNVKRIQEMSVILGSQLYAGVY
jgi:hypothetical protein